MVIGVVCDLTKSNIEGCGIGSLVTGLEVVPACDLIRSKIEDCVGVPGIFLFLLQGHSGLMNIIPGSPNISGVGLPSRPSTPPDILSTTSIASGQLI